MSRILPILFNTNMVRAILDGRKTVTRRIAKGIVNWNDNDIYWNVFQRGEWTGPIEKDVAIKMKAPYSTDSILYVRETYAWEACWDCGMDIGNGCLKKQAQFYNADKGDYGCYIYRASYEDNVYPSSGTWHPSIHMPKKAARIWLKVTDVRVERLQDITEDQAEMEGCGEYQTEAKFSVSPRCHFYEVWESTIKASDKKRYGWEANPFVWVIEFERCEKPSC